MERIIDLYEGTAIYRARLDEIRERDINARVMEKKHFERLAANMKADKRLESLPLCVRSQEKQELVILSGHHRTRAARAAGIFEIYVMVVEESLTEDQIKSKQLAHNALNGRDDMEVLSAIYNSIEDLEAKLQAGIHLEEQKMDSVVVKEINFDFNFEIVSLFFLPSQLTNFDKAIAIMNKSERIDVVDMENFPKFKEAARKVSGIEDIRNASAIVNRMSEIIIEYYSKREQLGDLPDQKEATEITSEQNGSKKRKNK